VRITMKYSRLFSALIFCASIACTTLSVHAQVWTALNPLPNQSVNTIIEFENALYAGTGQGLYRSFDKGQSWDNIGDFNNRTIVNLSVSNSELFVCPVSAGIWSFSQNEWKDISSNLPQQTTVYSVLRKGTSLFAATNFNGVYRSDNNGATWDIVGLPNLDVRSLIVSGNTLLAGALDFQADRGALFRSIDNGNTWQRSDTGLTSTFSKILVLGEKELFVGTLGGGVFISQDSARTWQPRSAGLTNVGVNALTWNKGILIAGTDAGGAFISRDSGNTWRAANSMLIPKKINDLINMNDIPYCATNLGVWSCDLSANSIDDDVNYSSSDWLATPQPAMTIVNIRSLNNTSIINVEMTDIMGAKVMTEPIITDNSISYQIAELSSGIYFVQIRLASGKTDIIPIIKQ